MWIYHYGGSFPLNPIWPLIKGSQLKKKEFCCFQEPFQATAQKMDFPIKDFFSKCDQIRNKLRIWSYFLKKSLMENFIFCAVSSKDFKPFIS